MFFPGAALGTLLALAAPSRPGLQETGPPPNPESEAPPAQETPAGQETPPPPGSPQDTASRVEELLRRLSEQDTESPVPGVDWLTPETGVTAPPPLSLLGALEPRAPEIHLSRVSDIVEVARVDGTRRVLQYWDSQLSLEAADEVRGSSKSQFIVDFPDGAWFRLEGPAVFRPMTEPLADPRRVEIPRLDVVCQVRTFEVPSTLLLPGGNQVEASNARLSIHLRDLRALEIRNSGPMDVKVRGPFLGDDAVTLPPGTLVFLPVFAVSGRGPEPAEPRVYADGPGAPLRLLAPERVGVEAEDGGIVLSAAGPVPEIVSVSGARFVISADRSLELRRAPLGLTRRKER